MNSSNQHYGGGIGFPGLLTVLFIALKLCGVIDWSWWWVLCPLWIGLAIGLSFFALFAVFGGLAVLVSSLVVWSTSWRKRK